MRTKQEQLARWNGVGRAVLTQRIEELEALIDDAKPLVLCEYALPCVRLRELRGDETECAACQWLARAALSRGHQEVQVEEARDV